MTSFVTEDAVREWRADAERATMLLSSADFQWFESQVADLMDKAAAKLCATQNTDIELRQFQGEVAGYRRVLQLLPKLRDARLAKIQEATSNG